MTERFHIDDSIFNFVEVENLTENINGKINCNHVRNGLHYVYAHFEADTKLLYYVGLGKFDRCNTTDNRNKYWMNNFQKHGLIIKFLAIDLTRADAQKLEKEFILNLLPKCNMSFGGESGDNRTRKVVYCYTKKDGTFYKKFNSLTEANAYFRGSLKSNTITKCIEGKLFSVYGHFWKDKYYEKVDDYKKTARPQAINAYRYDLEGNFIEELKHITKFTEGSYNKIYKCLDKQLTYKNSFWRSFKIAKIECDIPKSPKPRKVIDVSTGIIYGTITLAANYYGCPHETLRSKLCGKRKNNTTLQYYTPSHLEKVETLV